MKIGRLGGGGSDYSAFVQHIGVPSADLSFGEGKKTLQGLWSIIHISILAKYVHYIYANLPNHLLRNSK